MRGVLCAGVGFDFNIVDIMMGVYEYCLGYLG